MPFLGTGLQCVGCVQGICVVLNLIFHLKYLPHRENQLDHYIHPCGIKTDTVPFKSKLTLDSRSSRELIFGESSRESRLDSRLLRLDP